MQPYLHYCCVTTCIISDLPRICLLNMYHFVNKICIYYHLNSAQVSMLCHMGPHRLPAGDAERMRQWLGCCWRGLEGYGGGIPSVDLFVSSVLQPLDNLFAVDVKCATIRASPFNALIQPFALILPLYCSYSSFHCFLFGFQQTD